MKLNLNHKTYVEEDEELDRMKIQHFLLMKDKKMFYLCNQACGITKSKITNEYFKVTCKNCKRKLDKEKPNNDNSKSKLKEQTKQKVVVDRN